MRVRRLIYLSGGEPAPMNSSPAWGLRVHGDRVFCTACGADVAAATPNQWVLVEHTCRLVTREEADRWTQRL